VGCIQPGMGTKRGTLVPMNKTQMLKYINKRANVPVALMRAWLPILMEVGERNGYSKQDVLRFIVGITRLWAASGFAFQSLCHWMTGAKNETTRRVEIELARAAYHNWYS
jgi:hypothetical protein